MLPYPIKNRISSTSSKMKSLLIILLSLAIAVFNDELGEGCRFFASAFPLKRSIGVTTHAPCSTMQYIIIELFSQYPSSSTGSFCSCHNKNHKHEYKIYACPCFITATTARNIAQIIKITQTNNLPSHLGHTHKYLHHTQCQI